MREALLALGLAGMPLLTGCTTPSAAITSSQAPSLAVQQSLADMDRAERAFAAASLRDGIRSSFLAFVAPDAIIFRPGPVDAPSTLAADIDPANLTLDWWPAFAGMSASADLGFSVGPWIGTITTDGRTFYGYYVTVWTKQPDGQWKYVLDGGGARLRAPSTWPRERAALIAPTPMNAHGAAQDALLAEDDLNAALTGDHVGATMALLAPRSMVAGSGIEPQASEAASRDELARRHNSMRYRRLGSGASSAGDVVYTYGAVDIPGGADFHGHYVRIWQRSAERWQIVVDALSPDQD